MARGSPRLADLIHDGVSLFAQLVPFPASTLVAAASAAAIAKIVGLHKEHAAEILSAQLLPGHIPYVEPEDAAVFRFYNENPFFPRLATEFNEEIGQRDMATLRRLYPFLYSALVLKKQVPLLLFHNDIEKQRYRNLGVKYEALSRGYKEISGDVKVQVEINRFATDLIRVLNEVYAASEKGLKTADNRLVFEIIDYIREVAGA